ncbi:LuxR family transcriptional regulator [Methyloprofundus sedimenti]|uniref:LuxR family transcriptional regulator n=1 Tax=Methyloprofundus sedimenti TaxID=1420851 RepID=A0A1V8M2A4_9GAMM|nr:response regulator [Methyloprofundus sedimenti]OQK15675.1 LuxR family transcriptional regulator [Methyloprofundus sedimenti]
MDIDKQDINIFIVDDEFVIRDSLTLLLESAGFSKVKTYDSAVTFLEKFDPDQPSCLILDVRMPYMDGLELQHVLAERCAAMPIIFISGHADIPVSSQAFRAGAVDFLEKPFDNELLLERINEVIDKLLLNWSEKQEKKQILKHYANLSEREQEVFMLIVHNHSTKDVAKKLDISHRTVDAHRAHIMDKMQADSLNTLIMMAVKGSLI